MQELLQSTGQAMGAFLPNVLAALAILIVGWIVSVSVAALARGLVRRTSIGTRIESWLSTEDKKAIPVEKYVGNTVYYVLMLFVLIAFFQALKLTIVTEPLNNLLNQLFVYAPRLFGAVLLLAVAWILASALRFLVTKVLNTVKLDERVAGKMEDDQPVGISSTIANSVYWLTFLLFLPAVLSSLRLLGLLEPVQSMLDKMLLFLPNLFSAGIILVLGWFLARIVRRVVANSLAALGTNRLSERVGLAGVLGKDSLSDLIGLVVYALTLIPVLLIALDALGLEAITMPVSNMLNMMLASLPGIFAAFLIVVVAYVVAKLVSRLVSSLLAGFGFEKFIVNLGLMDESDDDEHKASDIVGYIAFLAILFVAVIQALEVLGFNQVSDIAATFTIFAANVLLALVIFGFGLFLSSVVANKILTKDTPQLKTMSLIARIAILFVAGAMALQQMGISGEIVTIAFASILGAIGIAAAVAFGIGGRDIAAKYLERWSQSLEQDQE